MISMIWLSQASFGDSELYATVVMVIILTGILVSFKHDEGGGLIITLFEFLIPAILSIFALIWNNTTTQYQDEETPIRPKKEKKKKKENPPPVPLDDKKKKNKKKKKFRKKIVSVENIEPPALKEKTKVYPSLDTCQKLNMDSGDIYNCLLELKLSKAQMLINNFPSDDYRPQTLVEGDNYDRICVRCNEKFKIYKGVHMSTTKCEYHPKRAVFSAKSGGKVYPCCDSPVGSPPCSVWNQHVTLQHGPKKMTKTASKRHVRKDLQRRIFGLDCEMSYTTEGLEVTRIGVVDIDGRTVYDSYVKPMNTILDYNTLYSGVEKRHLDHVTITIDDVKTILNTFIFEDTILIGHALNNDLAALGLIHNTIVDTSVLYSDPGCPMMKRSLKSLASKLLGMSIQDGPFGHDCIEDARACLQLALLKVPPKPPSPSGDLHKMLSDRPVRQPLIQNENYFYFVQQQSPIECENFNYRQRQHQALLEIQNSKCNFGTCSSRDQSGRRDGSFKNPYYYPTSLCVKYETNETFRYDPFLGCHRNYKLSQEKRGV